MGISSAEGWDTCPGPDNTPKEGGASRKPSSMGSSGGGEGGKSSGRREPSCLSSSWMRRSMLLMRTRRSSLGSPSGRWLYSFIKEMLKMVCRCKVYETLDRPSGQKPSPPPSTGTSSVLSSSPSSSSSSFRFAPLPNIYLQKHKTEGLMVKRNKRLRLYLNFNLTNDLMMDAKARGGGVFSQLRF